MNPPRLGLVWWVVVGGCAVGLLTLFFGPFRLGGYIVGGSLLFGAAARALLPTAMVPGVAMRSRGMDVLFYLLAGIAVLVIFAKVSLASAF